MVDIKIWYCLIYFNKEINFAIVYSLFIDHLEYCIMFVCKRKVTLFGVYSKLTNSIGSMGARPPGNSKIWGPPKDNLKRKIKKKI